jgi:hypothetical protein
MAPAKLASPSCLRRRFDPGYLWETAGRPTDSDKPMGDEIGRALTL